MLLSLDWFGPISANHRNKWSCISVDSVADQRYSWTLQSSGIKEFTFHGIRVNGPVLKRRFLTLRMMIILVHNWVKTAFLTEFCHKNQTKLWAEKYEFLLRHRGVTKFNERIGFNHANNAETLSINVLKVTIPNALTQSRKTEHVD